MWHPCLVSVALFVGQGLWVATSHGDGHQKQLALIH